MQPPSEPGLFDVGDFNLTMPEEKSIKQLHSELKAQKHRETQAKQEALLLASPIASHTLQPLVSRAKSTSPRSPPLQGGPSDTSARLKTPVTRSSAPPQLDDAEDDEHLPVLSEEDLTNSRDLSHQLRRAMEEAERAAACEDQSRRDLLRMARRRAVVEACAETTPQVVWCMIFELLPVHFLLTTCTSINKHVSAAVNETLMRRLIPPLLRRLGVTKLPDFCFSWVDLYRDYKSKWTPHTADQTSFNIRVFARFRTSPLSMTGVVVGATGRSHATPPKRSRVDTVTPAHQRRRSTPIKASAAQEARMPLVVRLRPQHVDMCIPNVGERAFTMNGVYDQRHDQRMVYNEVGRSGAMAALHGFNATLFAYGQTGAGKTFSMFGDPLFERKEGKVVRCPQTNPAKFGIVPRTCLHIMQFLEVDANTQFVFEVTYVEIYQNKIADLLNNGRKVILVV
jgi:hypothetical protein